MPVKMYFQDTLWKCPCWASYPNYVTYCQSGCKEENITLRNMVGKPHSHIQRIKREKKKFIEYPRMNPSLKKSQENGKNSDIIIKSMIWLNTEFWKVVWLTTIWWESYVFLDDKWLISLFPKDVISKESHWQPKEEYET